MISSLAESRRFSSVVAHARSVDSEGDIDVICEAFINVGDDDGTVIEILVTSRTRRTIGDVGGVPLRREYIGPMG